MPPTPKAPPAPAAADVDVVAGQVAELQGQVAELAGIVAGIASADSPLDRIYKLELRMEKLLGDLSRAVGFGFEEPPAVVEQEAAEGA